MTIEVALMVKAPRPGSVKTRLARTVGSRDATQIYRRLVEWQIAQIPRTWTLQIHFSPEDAADEMKKWLGPRHTYYSQIDGDLGDKLGFAMRKHFARRHTSLVFIGGDCPYLTTPYLNKMQETWGNAGAVLIPALDGGYCLLALNQPVHDIFESIPWNTNRVADETRQRLRAAGVNWKELPALEDVDDEPSWLRAKQALPELEESVRRSKQG